MEQFTKKSNAVEKVKYPFQKAVNIVAFVRDTSVVELRKEAGALIDICIPTLFEAARSEKGLNKEIYATTIKKIGDIVDEEEYEEALRLLMTNRQAVDELIRQGGEEKKPTRGLHEWAKKAFPWKIKP